MLKRTKDAFKQIAEKIEHAYEYNKTNQQSPIKLVSVEISRGLYNLGDEEIDKRQEKMLSRARQRALNKIEKLENLHKFETRIEVELKIKMEN